MAADYPILIPYTVDDDSASELARELASKLPEAEVRTARTPAETNTALASARILATFSLQDTWYDHLEHIDWIQALSAGVNHFDFAPLEREGVIVTNTSGVHAQPIAEQVLGYMLAFERNLVAAFENKQRGVWERFQAGELAGQTVGIIGVGAIGQRVAELCSAVGMEVVGTRANPDTPVKAVDALYGPEEVDTVLAAADYLVLACPLTSETEGLIDDAALSILSRDAVLINIARGAVVDESALTNALQWGKLRGAALDVTVEEPLPASSPLWDLSNVIITPHMAGSTPAYWSRTAEIISTNYRHFIADNPEQMENRVF